MRPWQQVDAEQLEDLQLGLDRCTGEVRRWCSVGGGTLGLARHSRWRRFQLGGQQLCLAPIARQCGQPQANENRKSLRPFTTEIEESHPEVVDDTEIGSQAHAIQKPAQEVYQLQSAEGPSYQGVSRLVVEKSDKRSAAVGYEKVQSSG